MRGYRDTGSSLSSDDTTFSFSPRRLASSSSPRRLATSSSSRRKSLRKANRNNRRKVRENQLHTNGSLFTIVEWHLIYQGD